MSFKIPVDDLLKEFSNYYKRMEIQIDYIDSLDSKYFLDESSIEELKKMYPEIYEQIPLNKLRIIQNVTFRQDVVEPLLNSMDGSEKEKLENIWVSFLPISSINAKSLHVPNTKIPTIILYDKVLGALHFYAESYLIARELEKIDARIENNFLKYSVRVILDYLQKKRHDIPLYHLPYKIKERAALWATAQEVFIVAHEFAHIYLNHLETSKSDRLIWDGKKINVKEFTYDQQQEFEADLQAFRWIMNLKKQDLDNSLLAFIKNIGVSAEIFIFFHIIEENLKEISTTHPASKDRLRYIYENIKDEISKEEREFIESMFQSIDLGFDIKDFKISKESEDFLNLMVNNIKYDII